MACFGKKCEIRKQEGRNVVVTTESSTAGCLSFPDPNEVVARLRQKAIQSVLDKANVTEHDCEAPCVCRPQHGATPVETEWETIAYGPVTASEGKCSVTIEGTLEVRAVNTPGLCRAGRITVGSIGFIPEAGVMVASERGPLSAEVLAKIKKALA